ncbi:MAG: hypothetical protein ACLSAF_11315 [Intestinimonas sp.]
MFAANYRGDKQAAEDALNAAYASPDFHTEETSFHLGTRIGVYMENMGSKILVLFMGLYLGMVFLLTAAAVLALQQLSQAADNAPVTAFWPGWAPRRRCAAGPYSPRCSWPSSSPWPWRWSMPRWV